MEKDNAKKYVVGVDGGGTKTVAALANLEGRILKTAKSGCSSPVNIGVKKATENIFKAIKSTLKKGEVLSIFIGLAAVQEQPRFKKEIKKELLKYKKFSQIFKGEVEVGSDQIVAFRAGTDERNGLLIIGGTGCVAHGWYKQKEVTASGWHWLADEGSAFWTGQRGFQAALKSIDGRGPKTLIKEMVFRRFKVKTVEKFLEKVYANPAETIPLFSIITDDASKAGDKAATQILKEAGQELALSAKTVIKKLRFQKKEFPLVLVGGMFKSRIVLSVVKKEVKKIAPRVKFIRPKKEPVVGAVKLALENLK